MEDRPAPFDEFLAICHAAKDQFAFLEAQGLRLTTEQWPSGDSFRDGFQLAYTGSPVSVTVEYYDMELVIWFHRLTEKIPYLFVDHELAANRSGFAGCMFARNKLADAVRRMADDRGIGVQGHRGHISNCKNMNICSSIQEDDADTDSDPDGSMNGRIANNNS